MKKETNIAIVGAGGIGKAAALLIRELAGMHGNLYLGDLYLEQAEAAVNWVSSDSKSKGKLIPFALHKSECSSEMEKVFANCQVLLDCLPGTLAPRYAAYAKKFDMHYANLTEYVNETKAIEGIAKGAKQGFVLQTGLAPGYINILGKQLFEEFCQEFKVDKASSLSMGVGALTQKALSPHYYGFTWSPVGVATEYIQPAIALRNGEITQLSSLSERSSLLVNGEAFEADLTSGGAADLPQFYTGKIQNLEYKTIRYPGHYNWVQSKIESNLPVDLRIRALQACMEATIPHYEEDRVVIYANVTGLDNKGTLRIKEKFVDVYPKQLAGKPLRAIQLTTAAALVEVALMLLEGKQKGLIHQSSLDAQRFMSGKVVSWAYGH